MERAVNLRCGQSTERLRILIPTECCEQVPPVVVRFCFEGNGLLGVGVSETEAAGVQHQAVGAAECGNGAVLAAVAVGGVADNGVEDVFHVAAQLVAASGVRREDEP